MDLLTEMNLTIASAKGIEELAPFATRLEQAVNKLGEVAMHMGMTAMSEKVLDVCMAWMELWLLTRKSSTLL